MDEKKIKTALDKALYLQDEVENITNELRDLCRENKQLDETCSYIDYGAGDLLESLSSLVSEFKKRLDHSSKETEITLHSYKVTMCYGAANPTFQLERVSPDPYQQWSYLVYKGKDYMELEKSIEKEASDFKEILKRAVRSKLEKML